MKTFVPRPLLLALTLVLIVCAIAYVELRFDRASAGNAQVVPDPPPAAQREETTEPSAAEQAPPERAGRESAEERVARKEAEFTRAAEIVGPTGFINTDGITIGENMGEKVVLIVFWNYSCYNCQNAQPYISQWHETYEDEGLLVIGVHRPEFEFEKDPASVEAAVREAGIEYPVVLDNNAATWDAYDNRYWPAWYLIDANGFVRYRHFGEGAYEETEAKIQALLAERDEASGS